MKRTTLLLLATISLTTCFSQSLPNFDNITLEKKEDYNADANKAALQAATYLFSVPFEKDNTTRLQCARYVVKWMSGTPDYDFTLDEKHSAFVKKDGDILVLYMAGMVKYTLENTADAKDANKVQLNATKLVIQYVKNASNNLKPNKELRKVIEADDKGQLKEYLSL